MIPSVKRNDKGLLPVLTVSLLLHATVYGLFAWLHLFPSAPFNDAPVYYVDVVNLPVESPQHGSPAAAGKESAPPAPVKPPPPEMKLPAKDVGRATPAAKAVKPALSASQPAEESAKEFEERLAKLERASDDRHAASALEALRKKAAGKGKGQAGMPGGTGTEAGSDYASYLRSRLVDAFRTTIAFQSKNPRVVMVLTIDRSGKVVKRRTESTTGDRLFEEAVNRAIIKAEKEFRPPPGGGTFEYGFIFSPKGVGEQ